MCENQMCDKIDLSGVSTCDLHKEAFHRFKQKDGCYDVSLKDSETITITGPAYILVAKERNNMRWICTKCYGKKCIHDTTTDQKPFRCPTSVTFPEWRMLSGEGIGVKGGRTL